MNEMEKILRIIIFFHKQQLPTKSNAYLHKFKLKKHQANGIYKNEKEVEK